MKRHRRKYTRQAARIEDSVEGRQVAVKMSMGSATFRESKRKNVYREKTKIPPCVYYLEETEN